VSFIFNPENYVTISQFSTYTRISVTSELYVGVEIEIKIYEYYAPKLLNECVDLCALVVSVVGLSSRVNDKICPSVARYKWKYKYLWEVWISAFVCSQW
jgi:hypothetical protein